MNWKPLPISVGWGIGGILFQLFRFIRDDTMAELGCYYVAAATVAYVVTIIVRAVREDHLGVVGQVAGSLPCLGSFVIMFTQHPTWYWVITCAVLFFGGFAICAIGGDYESRRDHRSRRGTGPGASARDVAAAVVAASLTTHGAGLLTPGDTPRVDSHITEVPGLGAGLRAIGTGSNPRVVEGLIRAWKGADIVRSGDGKLHLTGTGFQTSYEVEDEAVCSGGGRHEAPDPKCQCGFYGFAERERIQDFFGGMRPAVTLEVEFYGRVIMHQKGYRAQKQRVLAIHAPRGFTVPMQCAASVTRESDEARSSMHTAGVTSLHTAAPYSYGVVLSGARYVVGGGGGGGGVAGASSGMYAGGHGASGPAQYFSASVLCPVQAGYVTRDGVTFCTMHAMHQPRKFAKIEWDFQAEFATEWKWID